MNKCDNENRQSIVMDGTPMYVQCTTSLNSLPDLKINQSYCLNEDGEYQRGEHCTKENAQLTCSGVVDTLSGSYKVCVDKIDQCIQIAYYEQQDCEDGVTM
jgi:hypothetical protein